MSGGPPRPTTKKSELPFIGATTSAPKASAMDDERTGSATGCGIIAILVGAEAGNRSRAEHPLERTDDATRSAKRWSQMGTKLRKASSAQALDPRQALAARRAVLARAARANVLVGAAVEPVTATPGGQPVPTRAAQENVAPGPAADAITAASAVDAVVAAVPTDAVVAAVPAHPIAAGATARAIAPGSATDAIAAGAAADDVVSSSATNRVVSGEPGDHVNAVRAIERVIADGSFDGCIPSRRTWPGE